MTLKAQEAEVYLENSNQNTLCIQEKNQPWAEITYKTGQEKIFVNHTSDKKLISKIYEENTLITSRKQLDY